MGTLVAALGEQTAKAREGTSLKEQLGELADGVQAVEGIKQTIVDTLPEPPDSEDDTSPMVKAAKEHFVSQFLKSQDNPKPTTKAARFRPVKGHGSSKPERPKGIPDARV